MGIEGCRESAIKGVIRKMVEDDYQGGCNPGPDEDFRTVVETRVRSAMNARFSPTEGTIYEA